MAFVRCVIVDVRSRIACVRSLAVYVRCVNGCGRCVEAHVRVQTVCAEHSAVFDGTPGGQTARADLGAHVAEVDWLLTLQQGSIEDRRAATAQRRKSRRSLRDAAKAVVRVGRLVNLDAPVMDTMQLRRTANDDELLAHTRALLERVSAHADAFVAKGLPPDLLKRLENSIAAFAAAREKHAASRQRFTAAFESIQETLDKADTTVDMLEAIVLNTPDAPPELLTKLRIAKRVGPRVVDQRAPAPKPPQPTPTDQAA